MVHTPTVRLKATNHTRMATPLAESGATSRKVVGSVLCDVTSFN